MSILDEAPFGMSPGLQANGLGIRIKGVTYDDIINNADYFHRLFIEHKAIGFIRLHPTREQQAIITSVLSGVDVEEQLGRIDDQDHIQIALDQYGSDEDPFMKQGVVGDWHIDNPWEEYTTSVISLHMTKFDVAWGKGNTRFVDLEYLYHICPPEIRDYLATARWKRERESPKTSSPRDADTKDYIGYFHPALRTHPDTGKTCIYWTGFGMIPEDGDMEKMAIFEDWFVKQLDNMWEWYWSEGDLVVWDNRNLIHSFMGGWRPGDRIGDSIYLGLQKPYYSGSTETTTVPPNSDHIPFVWTKGIYANSGLEEYVRTVTLFVTTMPKHIDMIPYMVRDDGILMQESLSLKDEIGSDRFNVVEVPYDKEYDIFKRYREAYLPDDINVIGQKFLFSVNGDFAFAFSSKVKVKDDIELYVAPMSDEKALSPVYNYIRGLLHDIPALRHAGHAWHYPDWYPKQALQFRPWGWENLPFFNYLTDLDEPNDDMLLQQVMDIVFGAFNHKLDNDERKEFVQDVIDFLQLMIDLKEYEVER